MMVDRSQYQAWKQRYDALQIDGHYRDWVGAAIGLAEEILRDCADVSVTGWARLSKTHAQRFLEAKRSPKIEREYRNFGANWARLGSALNAQTGMRASR